MCGKGNKLFILLFTCEIFILQKIMLLHDLTATLARFIIVRYNYVILYCVFIPQRYVMYWIQQKREKNT